MGGDLVKKNVLTIYFPLSGGLCCRKSMMIRTKTFCGPLIYSFGVKNAAADVLLTKNSKKYCPIKKNLLEKVTFLWPMVLSAIGGRELEMG